MGVVIRDDAGRIMAAMGKHFHVPLGPLEVQAKAFEVGLQLAWDLGLQNVVLEGDSLVMLISSEFHSVNVSHVRRQGNQPAHLLAKVHSMIEKLAQFTDIRCCLVVGGLSTKVQEAALRSMPDIVVATPGRMIDHLRNSMSVDLEDLAVLILDEADRLLELGFSAEIRELVRLCPKRRQTMLFSATMTEEVDELI
nr:DEAD-box ATP-dependent RNA helicase 28-like [Quercus suber]